MKLSDLTDLQLVVLYMKLHSMIESCDLIIFGGFADLFCREKYKEKKFDLKHKFIKVKFAMVDRKLIQDVDQIFRPESLVRFDLVETLDWES